MSKDMTPMKRFSGNIQELRKNLARHFNELSLNKSSPKYNHHAGESTYSLGVESDFILIFSDPKKSISFALTFTYIDRPIEEQKISGSIKKSKSNDDIQTSQDMTLAEFKIKINQFNKWFETDGVKGSELNKSSVVIIEKFTEIFLDKKLDLNKELKTKQQQLDEFIATKSKELKISELTDINIKTAYNFSKAQNTIKNEIEAMPEHKELEALNISVNKLKQVISDKKTQLEKAHKIKDLKFSFDGSEKDLRNAKYNLEFSVQAELNKTSKVISKKLKY